MTGTSAIGRAISILTRIAASPTPLTASELARQLGIPQSNVVRLLQDLNAEGLVRLDSKKAATVGVEALRFAWQIKKTATLERTARPLLRQLVDEVGETATISEYIPSEGVSAIALIEYGPRSLSYVLEVGEIKHLNAGATGKSILAFLPPREIDAIITRYELPSVTELTTVDVERLGRELATIRACGYAITTGERIAGAVGVAAPIFAEDGKVFGSVGVTTPQHRFSADMEEFVSALVCRHAALLSQLMGGEELAGDPRATHQSWL